MMSLKHFAVASAAGISLTFGMVGCQPERPDVIPPSAQMLTSGNGMLHYEAPAVGTVYVYDHGAQRLLWSGMVWKGESVDFDPARGDIRAGGQVVVNKLAAPADQKDVYFDPAPPLAQPTVQSGASSNNGVLVTPSVTVQPSNGQTTNNGVTVQPGVHVTPTPGGASNP